MGSSNDDLYHLNERVFCLSRGLFYEAKILKVTDIGYKIHYQGWNKKYDEMVLREEAQEKLKKFSEEAQIAAKKELQEAKELEATNSKKKNEKKSKGDPASASARSNKNRSSSVAHARVDSIHPNIKMRAQTISLVRVDTTTADRDKRIGELPDELKQTLADDSWVIKEKKLYRLPSKYSVEAIVKEYCTHINETLDDASEMQFECDENGRAVNNTAIKFITSSRGVIDYFDALVSLQLLYKFERLQYVNHFERSGSPMVKPSAVYGLPHLLRFLLKFDELMEFNPWDDDMMNKMVGEEVTKFMKFLVQEKDKFCNLQRDTTPATLDYTEEAQL